jgi:hypothetical protein
MAVLACSIYLSLGFVALGSLATLTSVAYANSNVTIAEWTESLLAVAVGFGLLVTGWLVGSRSQRLMRLGGMLGILLAIGGALNGLALAAISNSYGSGLTYLVPVGSWFVLFVGFPLAMAGSMGGLLLSETEQSAAPKQA